MKNLITLFKISLKGTLFFVLLLCIFNIKIAKASNPMFIRSGITEDPTTMKTITWMQDPSDPASAIMKLAKKSDGESSFVNYTGKTMDFVYNTNYNIAGTNGGANISKRAYSVTVKGLEPATTYIYQVGDGTKWSNTLEFTTPAATDRFTFFVLGDLQAYSDTLDDVGGTGWLRAIARKYANPATKPLFSIQVGDLVEREHVYNYYKLFGDVCDDYPDFANTDMIGAMGNHEYYRGLNNTANLSAVTDPPRGDISKFLYGLPVNNNSSSLGTGTYSVDYGNIHIIVLDLQDGQGMDYATYTAAINAQAAWMRSDLANCKKPWKILVLHYPIYYDGTDYTIYPSLYMQTAFGPVCDAYGVQLVVAGHVHTARRSEVKNGVTLSHGYNSTVQPGGTVYVICGQLADCTDATVYLNCAVDSDKMTVNMIQHNGPTRDSFTMNAGDAPPPPPLRLVMGTGFTGTNGPNAPNYGTPVTSTPAGSTLYLGIDQNSNASNPYWIGRDLCTLTSSDTNVATIDDAGIITANAEGTTTIKAVRTSDGETGTITLTVAGVVNGINTPKEDGIRVSSTPTGISVQFEGNANVELYNVNGILIDKAQAVQSYSRNLAKGVYILRVNDQTMKFIK